jgi:hypothetical protein
MRVVFSVFESLAYGSPPCESDRTVQIRAFKQSVTRCKASAPSEVKPRREVYQNYGEREKCGSRDYFIFQGERMTAALLDRLTHHCHIFEINGESYRFRESMKSKKGRKTE